MLKILLYSTDYCNTSVLLGSPLQRRTGRRTKTLVLKFNKLLEPKTINLEVVSKEFYIIMMSDILANAKD